MRYKFVFLKRIFLIPRICSVSRYSFQSSGYKRAEHGDIYHQVRTLHCSVPTVRWRRTQYGITDCCADTVIRGVNNSYNF